MFKKIIKKLYFKYVIDDLVRLDDVSEELREKAYISLYKNKELMTVLRKMLTADLKEMMKQDWMANKSACVRYGMFTRIEAIRNKAEAIYLKSTKEKPIEVKK